MQLSDLCNAVIKFLSTQSALFISVNHINKTPTINTKSNTNHGLVGKRLECRRCLCWARRLLNVSMLGKNKTLLWNRIEAALPKLTLDTLCCMDLFNSNGVGGIIFLLCDTDLMLHWTDGQLMSLNHHRSRWRNDDYFQSWVWHQYFSLQVHLFLLSRGVAQWSGGHQGFTLRAKTSKLPVHHKEYDLKPSPC